VTDDALRDGVREIGWSTVVEQPLVTMMTGVRHEHRLAKEPILT
jgi:hypothetical protein